jgi:hypothetical protein
MIEQLASMLEPDSAAPVAPVLRENNGATIDAIRLTPRVF